MANVPPPFPGHLPGYRHVCMMEGPDPNLRLSTLQYDTILAERDRHANEIRRLKVLLKKHNIEFDTSLPVGIKYVSKNESPEEPTDEKPRLPTEILLRILGFALTSPVPIIDPFYKLRYENVTAVERFSRQYININLFGVSRMFAIEGLRILIEKNEFIFTQPAAVENFVKVPTSLRNEITKVTFRVVGRYYNDEARKIDLTGNGSYHDDVSKFSIPGLKRPRSMVNDKGIQAYCWHQVADFLKALQLPRDTMSSARPKLLPALQTMRMDLVNFCDHLPLGIATFSSVIRWHLGRILDELIITGLPEAEASADETMVLRNLLRDEGLLSVACPAFISVKDGLKSLNLRGYNHQVVCLKAGKTTKKKSPSIPHPEGGKPPKSAYPKGHTIWKWTKDFDNQPKNWIEFDRASGRPMLEIEEEEAAMEEDEDDDGQPDFGALLGIPLPFLPMFAPPPFNGPPPPNPGDDEWEDEDLEGMPELIDPEE